MQKLKLLFVTRDFSKNVDPMTFYLQQEFAKQMDLMVWYDEGDIQDILKQVPAQPDFILLNDLRENYCPTITGLANLDIPFGALVFDVHWMPEKRHQFIEDNHVRYLFSHYRDRFYYYYPEFANRMKWWPLSFNPTMFKDYGLKKEIDMLMMGAISHWAYPLREKILNTMQGSPGFVYHPHPGYRDFTEAEAKQVWVGEKYAREINRAKLFFTDGGIFGYPVLKHYEILACKTLLLAPATRELRDLGFEPGVHFVEIEEDNFLEKANYYLSHEEERITIAEAGYQMVHQRHTVEVRVREFVQMVADIIQNHHA